MEESYLARLEKLRWPDGRCCSFCGSTSISKTKVKGINYRCYKHRGLFNVFSNSFAAPWRATAEILYLLIDLAADEFPAYMVTRMTGMDHGCVKRNVEKIRAAANDDFLRRIKIDIAENGA